MNKKKRDNLLFIRYIQSPLKSIESFDKSIISGYANRIKVDYYNYILIECFKKNSSEYMQNQILAIKRYLMNNIRRLALKIISIYAKIYHVNDKALIQDNYIYHFKNINWLKFIDKLNNQLQKIHHYPNFRSLFNSKYSSLIELDFDANSHQIKNEWKYKQYLKSKLPLHIKIRLLHIPLAKHARIKLARLRKGHKHYLYRFSATRGKWHQNTKWHPFGPEGSVIFKNICYHGNKMTNHMWMYGKKNLQNILPMHKGTRFEFSGWVSKYLKHHNRYYDYRISHIRNVKIIKNR